MADKKVSELGTTVTLGKDDFFLLVQGGVSKGISAESIFASIPSKLNMKEVPDTLASGALTLTKQMTLISAPSANIAYTLATPSGGSTGDIKELAATSVGGGFAATVTVSGGVGFTTITFNATGQTASLKNVGGSWYVMNLVGAVLA